MPGGLEITPVDELTRLPLPVLMSGTDFSFKEANYHHHFHPSSSSELGYDERGKKLPTQHPEYLGGRALRYSRGQHVPKWLHNRYHDIFYGPPLPQNIEAKFTTVVLACAGVVPREAIDLYAPGDYRQVTLDNRQHDFIRRRIYYEGAASRRELNDRKGRIGKFLAEYALNHSLKMIIEEDEVKKKVDEFLLPKSEAARRAAGRFLLEHAIDASVAELIPLHQEAIKEGMIRKPRKKLGEIVLKYFPERKFMDYFDPLEARLAAEAA